VSLSEILQVRRHGKTPSNNDTNSSRDLKNRRQGVANHGADYDDVDYSQNSGQPNFIVHKFIHLNTNQHYAYNYSQYNKKDVLSQR